MIANSSKVLEGTWWRQPTSDSLEDDLAYS
jgi:hypothetical protein